MKTNWTSKFWVAAIVSSLLHAAIVAALIGWGVNFTAGMGEKSVREPEIRVKIKRLPPEASSVQKTTPRVATNSQQLPTALSEQLARALSRVKPQSSDQGETTVSAKKVLEDPKTGLIFSAYFKVVKARLARNAEIEGASPHRAVPVRFVLTQKGELESVVLPPDAEAEAQILVHRLLESASPFPPFPSSIHHASIAFDVLFRFD